MATTNNITGDEIASRPSKAYMDKFDDVFETRKKVCPICDDTKVLQPHSLGNISDKIIDCVRCVGQC